TTVIDMSTISPEATVVFAERLLTRESYMLDAPVSGGELGAVEATLGIMVGGAKESFEKYLPVFRAMGKTITYAGPSGSGQKTKLVNQVIGAMNILATVEGLRLAQALGLNVETTLRAASSGAASSWALTNLGPKILKNDFAAGFSIRLQHKDLRLVCEVIRGLKRNSTFPGTDLVASLFATALEKGLSEQGNHALIKVWEEIPQGP
ncbi:MAG: NAD(P)-dependent oxidoreductase, partial [Terriglobia bacterium]